MPTTRNAAKKQSKSENAADDSDQKPTVSNDERADEWTSEDKKIATNAVAKRKAAPSKSTKSAVPEKKQKQQQLSSQNIHELREPVMINRAPVLQLWGAVVAHFLYPDLSWPACLSIGNAISTLCAISKGKAIGMIEPKDDAEAGASDEGKKAKSDLQQVEVMGFPLRLDGEAVLMSGKPKPYNESALKHKFGEEQYDAAKDTMSEALQSWSDDQDELNKKAFHMYEKFRPTVASGQRGWGRKGELNLHEVKNAITRP